MNDELYLMWLTTISGLGIRRQRALLDSFSSAREIFHAPAALLRTVPGLTENVISGITDAQDMDALLAYRADMEQKRISFISYRNPLYPALLKEIYDPPTGLYILGDLPDDDMIKVSVIGSRRCTEYGLTVSRMLSKELSRNNVVVVSGMARGIDSMAHKGAIEGGGRTIAVLGNGVDICYPAENERLRLDIINNGCLLSEFPPGTHPQQAFFPMRNRIISGLSKSIVVVEAAKKSGTLITVGQALDQGRDVMAVPGKISSKLSEGTNDLIKQGAAVVTCCEDILNNLGIFKDIIEERKDNINVDLLAPEEKLVYSIINFEPVSFDEIVFKSSSKASVVTYLLTMLELKGLVQKLPGQRFIRVI